MIIKSFFKLVVVVLPNPTQLGRLCEAQNAPSGPQRVCVIITGIRKCTLARRKIFTTGDRCKKAQLCVLDSYVLS